MGKFIDKIKTALDVAADALEEKADEIANANTESMDFETGGLNCSMHDYPWDRMYKKFDRFYNHTNKDDKFNCADNIKKAYTDMMNELHAYNKKAFESVSLTDDELNDICNDKGCLSDGELNNICNDKKDECNDPIAIDIYGDYIYMGDIVIPVDYNDTRYPYISIAKNYKAYEYRDLTGPVWRKVILKESFDQMQRDGQVELCERSGFYHVEFDRD